MTVLVVGQERTGTHTLSDMLNASGIPCVHEGNPTLCFEAYNRVVKGTVPDLTEKIKSVSGRAEANHRLQFFVDIFAREMPGAKFIFLVRDPVRVVTSLVGTMAHWPMRTPLPKWVLERIEKYVPPNKKEFNLYRIPPPDFRHPLPVLHLHSWLRGLSVSLPLLEKLEDRLKIIRIDRISSDGPDVWKWLGLAWDEKVSNSARQKSDSMYGLFGSDNLAAWAEEQTKPHSQRIYEEFNSYLNRFEIGRKIISILS